MLKPGTHLGPHEILSLIGAGGMGEVYKALDTRLDRIVALKVLLAHLADRPDVRERFEREAKTIANLKHPNICVLYDIGHQDGIDYLVMEYLEGETLAQRLAKGPLPLEQVLRYAVEIADALDKAHRAGVTHRDIKPGNIMLVPQSGTGPKTSTKLLDFGLAKLRQEVAPPIPRSELPTGMGAPTAQGTLLGTLQYMAPEQVEGKVDEIDGRTDVFAFGAVVYEMATGKKAFEGKTQASVIAKILEIDPPPMSSLQPMTPPALDHVVKTCLAKDPEDRWQTARDLCRALAWIREAGAPPAVQAPVAEPKPVAKGWRRVLLWSLAGVVLGALLASITLLNLRRSQPLPARSPKRFTISLPAADQLERQGLALSPDGKNLVYIGRRAGVNQLYRRSLDQLEASPISGTEGAQQPFFSPNGEWVGFFAGGKLKKVTLAGGLPMAICDVTGPRGASWGPDDMIVFAALGSGLLRVPAAGGSPQPLTMLDSSQSESDHWSPDILPGGQAVLFTAFSDALIIGRIAVQSVKTGQRRILLEGMSPRFVPTGHIVFVRGGSLWGVPFDLAGLQLTGSPAPLVEGIAFPFSGVVPFALASDESLVYTLSDLFAARRLVWVNRKGVVQPLSAPTRPYEYPRLSPDGQWLALGIRDESRDVWSYELARGTLTRLTFDPGEDESPVWMPDGKRIAFAGDRAGTRKLLSKLADGSGTEEELLVTRGGHRHPSSRSPDGQVLAFDETSPGTGYDIWVMSLQGDRKPRPFLQTPFGEIAAAFSPDGRWLAYVSNESGLNEVYVQAYPPPGGRWQISTEGGVEPVWARSGRELFYRNGDKMMAVDIRTEPSFSAGTPRVLFEGKYEYLPWVATNYDVSPDGQRFLMIQAAETGTAPSQIHVVLNWFEELKRKVPGK